MVAILEDPRALPTQVLATFMEPLRLRDAVRDVIQSPEYNMSSTDRRTT